MKNYIRTDGTKKLYSDARNKVSLYMQVRVDELMSEFDLTIDEAIDTVVMEMTNMAKSLSYEIA